MNGAAARVILVLTLSLAACTPPATGIPSASPSPATASTASGARGPIPINGSPAPAVTATTFDPSHVAEVLGPAVGVVIVNTRSGGQEGSGFVVLNQGSFSFMVTNNHVVEGATKVSVLMPDGRHFASSVQGTDPQGDLAVVKIPDGSLPKAEFGDSTKLVVGQRVVAIGSPLGNQGSVTQGVISALHRTITAGSGRTSETLADVIQTDAAINPGNSGGPLADASGRVIGVNSAGATNASGIGFAIPSLVVKRIAEALIAGRPAGHPYLGVCFTNQAAALANGRDFQGYGAIVDKVLPNGPAERSLKTGDVIEKVDGVALVNGQTLAGLLEVHNPGEKVTLTVLRGTSTTDVQITLGDKAQASGSC
jgi:S1-C subfamily serine protease